MLVNRFISKSFANSHSRVTVSTIFSLRSTAKICFVEISELLEQTWLVQFHLSITRTSQADKLLAVHSSLAASLSHSLIHLQPQTPQLDDKELCQPNQLLHTTSKAGYCLINIAVWVYTPISASVINFPIKWFAQSFCLALHVAPVIDHFLSGDQFWFRLATEPVDFKFQLCM